MRADYCPMANEPCQSMCDVSCSAHRLKPADDSDMAVYKEIAKNYSAPQAQPAVEPSAVFYRCNHCGHGYEDQPPSSCDCSTGYGFERVEYFTAPQAQQPRKAVKLSDDEVREIYLANGFTVKEGQTDLKPYVFESARAIEQAVWEKLGVSE